MDQDSSLLEFLQFIGREPPAQENAEVEEHVKDPPEQEYQFYTYPDRDSVIELSDDEANDTEQVDNPMKTEFDALIEGKSEDGLIQIASIITRHFMHKDFASKAQKLLDCLEGIWATNWKKFEENNDGKCAKCGCHTFKAKDGRCKSCYQKKNYLRKKLNPESYKKCVDCHKVEFLVCAGQCRQCYKKDLEKRNREAAEKVNKRESSPINGPIPNSAISSQYSNHGQQPDIKKESERKRKPSIEKQASESSKRQKSSQPNNVLNEQAHSSNDQQASESSKRTSNEQAQPPEQAVFPSSEIVYRGQSLSNEHSHGPSSGSQVSITPKGLKCFGCGELFDQDESSKDRICMNCCKIALMVNSRQDSSATASKELKCFGCGGLFDQDESSKDRICMNCCKIALIVNSRQDLPI